ncbi:MAG: hypothetical protein A3J97_03520 [Spirochaetes bacterium RIFOXYC1_FULL_54_7]|nr:MAG: hypothetical protein A3J97_03520 [Spirochaetes bacterium RIFOXYC1_FULL_54_7]
MKNGKVQLRVAVFLMSWAVLSLASCKWIEKIFAEHTLTQVLLTVDKSTLIMGEAVQIGAKGIYADSDEEEYLYNLTWSSSNSSIVSIEVVTQDGVATAKAHNITGTATITGKKNSVQATITFTVVMPEFTGLYVQLEGGYSPYLALVPFGYTYQFKAMGFYENYQDADITQYVSWTSSVPDVGTINETGLMTTIDRGITHITANLGELISSSCQTDVRWAIDVTIDLPDAPGGSSVLFSGLFSEMVNLDGMFPADTLFTGGTLSARLVTAETSFYNTAPTTTTALVFDGTYYLHVIADVVNDGQITTDDLGVIRTVTKTGSVHEPETISAYDFTNLVDESVIITSSSIPDGALLYAFWQVRGDSLINIGQLADFYDYLTSSGSSGYAPRTGFRSWSAGTFGNSDGTITAVSNIPLIPGVYNLSIAIDADANGVIGEGGSGDYHFLITDVTVSGSGTNIDTALGNATPY